MKPVYLVLIITLVLCLTLVVTGLPQQQPGQPVISLDFPQYCVGDPWTLRLSSGVPNTPVRLLGNSNGQSWEIAQWNTTNGAGNYGEQGMFAPTTVGRHALQIEIAGTASQSLSFVVFDCPPNPRIAFVSTRDGEGGPPVYPLRFPYIYVANADGSGVRRLTFGRSPAWSGDGRKIVFHRDSRGGTNRDVGIHVINADGSGERFLGPGSFPSWSPDDMKIVFHSEGGISVMNADGSGVTQVVSKEFANPGYMGAYEVQTPRWSPDGRSIAFVRANYEDPWTVHLLDLATSEIHFLRVGASPSESRSAGSSPPAWSPDGKRLLLQVPASLFPSPAGLLWSIASIHQDGSSFQMHTQAARYVGNPDWSPDGRRIMFETFTGPGDQTSSVGSRMRIFVAGIEDVSSRQLIPDAIAPALPDYGDSDPAWSRVRR